MPAKLDPDVRATLETAALLMREGYVVKDANHAYEDAAGHECEDPSVAVAGCGIMCVKVAAWFDPDVAEEAFLAVDSAAGDYFGWISVLRSEGPAGCIAVIERALAGADS
jgi:hypothetical protein